LNSTSKNIRGFVSLVLANRNETTAIPEIMKLANDEHSIVRSCVIGALEHLKAQEAKEIFLESLLDSNLEVKKSALHAIINLNIAISEDKMEQIVKEKDPEIEKLLSKLKK
jgi:HEAT repeat protein